MRSHTGTSRGPGALCEGPNDRPAAKLTSAAHAQLDPDVSTKAMEKWYHACRAGAPASRGCGVPGGVLRTPDAIRGRRRTGG